MNKDDILKRANKDLAKLKASGVKPTGIKDRDPYPASDKTVKTKKKPNSQKG